MFVALAVEQTPPTVAASMRQLARPRSFCKQNSLPGLHFTSSLRVDYSGILRCLVGAPSSPSATRKRALRGRASIFYSSPAHLRVLLLIKTLALPLRCWERWTPSPTQLLDDLNRKRFWLVVQD